MFGKLMRSVQFTRLVTVLLLCATPMFSGLRAGLAAEEADSPGTSGNAVICYHDSVGYVIVPPKGWVDDREAAARLGICALYVLEGTTYGVSPAIIYPKAAARVVEGSLAETARVQAEQVREYLQSRWDGQGPTLEEGPVWPGDDDKAFAVWLFNQGPPPNNWEAAAYLPEDRSILMLVLSAPTREDREAYMPALEAMAGNVFTIKVKVRESAR